MFIVIGGTYHVKRLTLSLLANIALGTGQRQVLVADQVDHGADGVVCRAGQHGLEGGGGSVEETALAGAGFA